MSGPAPIILHVGAPKTGTTAIQQFLHLNRDRLPGFSYPRAMWASQARRMRVYARYPRLGTRDAQLLRIDQERLSDVCRAYEALTRTALRSTKPIIGCNELLYTLEPEEIARLGDLYCGHDIGVVLYIRRQDQLAVSAYLQAAKRDMRRRSSFPSTPRRGYREAIQAWSALGEVTVRIYERESLPGGDVIRDFLTVIGMDPETRGLVWPQRSNPTWGRLQLLLGQRLNQHFPFLDASLTRSEQMGRRADLVRFLDRLPQVPAPVASRAQAQAYASQFDAENEWIRRRYFPQRARLFSEDFSMYPESIEAAPLTVDEVVNALVEMWRFHAEELAQARALSEILTLGASPVRTP